MSLIASPVSMTHNNSNARVLLIYLLYEVGRIPGLVVGRGGLVGLDEPPLLRQIEFCNI